VSISSDTMYIDNMMIQCFHHDKYYINHSNKIYNDRIWPHPRPILLTMVKTSSGPRAKSSSFSFLIMLQNNKIHLVENKNKAMKYKCSLVLSVISTISISVYIHSHKHEQLSAHAKQHFLW